jgi:serine/threonine protein phosphatase PrpC
MTRLSSLIQAKVAKHRELIERWDKKERPSPLQRPEHRINDRIMANIRHKGVVSLGVGKEFHERARIAKGDIDRFALLYSMGKGKFKSKVKMKIVPIMKRGYTWEDYQSSKLRQEYHRSADEVFGMFDTCDLNTETFSDGASIELHSALSKSSEYLEFCSAAGIVDKKPRKRKEDKGGDAVFFKEMYSNGKRMALFGVFDGLADKRGDESGASALAMEMLKNYSERIKSTRGSEEIKELLNEYANEADIKIGESMNNFGGTTASIGVVFGKTLIYLNIGDTRIYAVSFKSGKPSVKKITFDDGISSAVELGAGLPASEFSLEAGYPHLYLGSFSQQIYSRYSGKRVMHQGFRLKHPNIGAVNLDGYDMVFAVTDGIWKQFPLLVAPGNIVKDSACEESAGDIIRMHGCKGPKDLVESLHLHAITNMKSNMPRHLANNYCIMPVSEDMGAVAFSI